MSKLKSISILGNSEAPTGYGTHCKNIVEKLKEKGIKIEQGLKVGEPCLAITTPEYWETISGNRHTPFIPFLIFEGTRLNQHWTKLCNSDYVTEILVPSKHVKTAAILSGVNKKITIAPHGINTKIYNSKVKDSPKLKNDNFKFLMVGGWGQGAIDRKGFQYALKAFTEEFSKEDNVEIYWKINMSYNPGLNIGEELNKLDLKKNGLNLNIITKRMTTEKLAELYKTCDVLIAPSMAEGFNLPCIESMACGTPVITTAYGGVTDYVNENNGWLIPVERMINSTGVPKHIYEDAEWAVPSVVELQKIMREAYSNPELVKKKGKESIKTSKEYTWDKTVDIIVDRFEKYI